VLWIKELLGNDELKNKETWAAKMVGAIPVEEILKAGSEKVHIPPNLVVDHWTSDGESRSHRDDLLLHDVWTTSNRLSGSKITSTISMS